MTKTSSRSATHSGTCQLCGSLQKLPKGVLAKHGYTTRFGFFEGICPGSDNLPFELSCDLIEDAITRNENMIELISNEAAEIRARDYTGVTKAWSHIYFSARFSGEKSGYRWIEVEVSAEDRKLNEGDTWVDFYATYEIERAAYGREAKIGRHRMDIYSMKGERTLTNVVAWLWEKFAAHKDSLVAQRRDYTAYLRQRVASWKHAPEALVPVKAK